MTLRILSGKYKGRLLRLPKGSSTRPTLGIVRAAIFNICRLSLEGAYFLDLFAGSGAMGLEALSQGASFAVFVEQNRIAARCIAENLDLLHLQQQGRILTQELFKALSHLKKKSLKFNLIYIDPPYRRGPFIPDILYALISHSLCAPRALIFAESSTEELEFSFSSPYLKQTETRTFGIARIHQFEYVG